MIMRTALKLGLILGVAVCAWTMLVHLLGGYTVRIMWGQFADIAVLILPMLAIIFALRERTASAGSLSFGDAIAVGLGVGVVSVPIAATFLWYSHHWLKPALGGLPRCV